MCASRRRCLESSICVECDPLLLHCQNALNFKGDIRALLACLAGRGRLCLGDTWCCPCQLVIQWNGRSIGIVHKHFSADGLSSPCNGISSSEHWLPSGLCPYRALRSIPGHLPFCFFGGSNQQQVNHKTIKYPIALPTTDTSLKPSQHFGLVLWCSSAQWRGWPGSCRFQALPAVNNCIALLHSTQLLEPTPPPL